MPVNLVIVECCLKVKQMVEDLLSCQGGFGDVADQFREEPTGLDFGS